MQYAHVKSIFCHLRICLVEVFNPYTQYPQQCITCYYIEEHPYLYCFATI